MSESLDLNSPNNLNSPNESSNTASNRINASDQTRLIQSNVGFLYPYGLENKNVFWPAMIIPEWQIDSSLPKIQSNEMLLQFFEKKVAVVLKSDETFIRWDSCIEPFKSFVNTFINHKTSYIRKAAIFMKSGYIDQSLKWKIWKDLSIQNLNISRNPLKRKSRSQTIESDLSDWTDDSSLVSID